MAQPQKFAEQVGRSFGEFLKRALTQSVALREPKDVAWFLASYARDALQRVEAAGALPALGNVRSSLEEALGMTFEAEKGEHFFRSTLVQTLFYGVFSAWVLWAREMPRSSPRFDWRSALWHLNVPFIKALFQQIANAGGAPFQIYILPLRLPPAIFVGTNAMFFAFMNWLKLIPIALLGQLSLGNLATSTALLPLAIASTWLGIWLIRRMSSAKFYPVITALLFCIGLRLLWTSAKGFGWM